MLLSSELDDFCGTSNSPRGASPEPQRSEASARRRQGADVRVLIARPRPDPTAPVGVARLRAAPSRPPAPVGIPASRGAPRLDRPVPVGATGSRRVLDVLVEDRDRSGSPRTARHHRIRFQLTAAELSCARPDLHLPLKPCESAQGRASRLKSSRGATPGLLLGSQLQRLVSRRARKHGVLGTRRLTRSGR